MWNCGYGMMGGWGWLGALFSLLVLTLIIGGVILIVHRLTNNPGGSSTSASSTSASSTSASSAEAILAERYACSEIDDQEYQQRLATLRAKR